jgi:uncharacterized OB-fold protein
MADTPARSDLPTIEAETRPYWDAAADGKLLLRACSDCGTVHHYPRPFCPACWSENVEWVEASGRATLYTWSTVFVNDMYPFRERLPYIAAVVDLAEGPRMMTNVVDAEPDDLAVGMDLEVTFRPVTDEITAPVFRPAAS